MKMLITAVLAITALAAHADEIVTARYACKQFIERDLHDPGSADLSEWTRANVTRPKPHTFKVVMRVRAKNAFNATRIGYFECLLHYRGNDDWRALSVRQLQ